MQIERNAPRRQAATHYRRGYLRYRSVLHDPVAELPVLAAQIDELRRELDSRSRLGLVSVEVGNLEVVESLYGWQVFDRLRGLLAACLTSLPGVGLPEASSWVLDRVAGERFLCFIHQRDDRTEVEAGDLPVWTELVARRLEAAMDGEAFAGLNPRLEFRCGYATLSLDPFYRFERRVYMAVDAALRCTERRSRRRELAWGEELQGIIQDARLQNVFQPVLDLRTRDVIGYEALIRGPEDSQFARPASMFELSQRLGIDDALDAVCRRSALRHTGALADGQRLFVNVTARSLEQGAPALRQALEEAPGNGTTAERTVIEVSERGERHGPERWIDAVEALRAAGARFALDDVGTGPNSHGLIRGLRPDYVKLDGSLVRNIHKNLIQQELLKTLMALADEVGADVIAEGVESEDEARTLIDNGARYGQGYLYAVPSPVSPGETRSDAPGR